MGARGWLEGSADGQPRTHLLSDGPLPYRKILDVGVRSYDELACSRSTLSWLSATWSDVALQVVEQCPGGHNVIVRAWPKEEKH